MSNSDKAGVKKGNRRVASRSVTLSDVARLAGVSTASVSRALNIPSAVSDEKRQRVLAAVERLQWIPNGAARALASTRSGTIGALMPNLWHQTFSTMVESLQDDLAAAGYTLLLGCWGTSQEREVGQALKMIERGIECLVLLGEEHSPQLFEALRQREVPYVVMFTSGRQSQHPCIGFDNYETFKTGVQHLLDQGHRRFAMIAQDSHLNDRVQQRTRAARDVLASKGIAIRPQHYLETPNWTVTGGRLAFLEVMKGEHRPTALICSNDYLAVGALAEAKAQGILVPTQLSVIGFDDIEMASHTDPPLTTTKIPDVEIGRAVAKYIIDLLEHKTASVPKGLQATFVPRQSTGPVPGQDEDADR